MLAASVVTAVDAVEAVAAVVVVRIAAADVAAMTAPITAAFEWGRWLQQLPGLPL